jgi:hypothetical protein
VNSYEAADRDGEHGRVEAQQDENGQVEEVLRCLRSILLDCFVFNLHTDEKVIFSNLSLLFWPFTALK